MPDWQPLGTPAPADLVDARIQLHFAAQHVAAIGAALAVPRPDASHKSFTYDPQRSAVVGVRIDGPPPFRAALVLPRLTLQLLGDAGDVLAELPLTGQTDAAVLQWLEAEGERVLGLRREVPPHRYDTDFPTHAVGEGAAYSTTSGSPALAELDRYYANTQLLIESVMAARDHGPSRIWPHHFDLAALIAAGKANDGRARTVGVGMAPGDAGIEEPYWYVSPWPFPDASRLPKDDGLATWRAEPWFGARLPASVLLAAGGDQAAQVTAFAEAAIERSLALLGA